MSALLAELFSGGACILIHRVPAWCAEWCTLALGSILLESNFPHPGTCLSWRLYLALLLIYLCFIDLGCSCPQNSSFLYLAIYFHSFPSPSLLSHFFILSCLLCVCGMHVCGHAHMCGGGLTVDMWCLCWLLSILLMPALLLNLELTDLTGLASLLAFGGILSLCLPTAGIMGWLPHASGFYVSAGDPNSSSNKIPQKEFPHFI